MKPYRQIALKNKYLMLIAGLCEDYDGLNTEKDLKGLIDDIHNFANLALNNNDKAIIFGGSEDGINMGVPMNIFMEEIKEE